MKEIGYPLTEKEIFLRYSEFTKSFACVKLFLHMYLRCPCSPIDAGIVPEFGEDEAGVFACVETIFMKALRNLVREDFSCVTHPAADDKHLRIRR